MLIRIKARELFQRAVQFINQNPLFAAYYFFLALLAELYSSAFYTHVTESLRTNNLRDAMQSGALKSKVPVGSIWQYLLPERALGTLQQPYMLYLLCGLFFVFLFLYMVVNFSAQAILRKKNTTLLYQISNAFNALVRAPWALLYMLGVSTLLYLFRIGMTRNPLIAIPVSVLLLLALFLLAIRFYYLQPLLYDNYYSLTSVAHTSWRYVEKSWFVVLKYRIMLVALRIVVNVASIPCALLCAESSLMVFITFIIMTYLELVATVGYNMIYLHVRDTE
jgi:hypothetical protein